MRKGFFLATFALLLFSLSCKHSGYDKTASGMYVKLLKSNAGPKLNYGDMVFLNMRYKTEINGKDSVLFSTDSFRRLVPWLLDKGTPSGGFNEGILKMTLGDSAAFIMRADSVFEHILRVKRPENIKADQDVVFGVKIVKFEEKAIVDKRRAELLAVIAERKEKEAGEIANYVSTNKITAQPDANGLYYIEKQAGSGNEAKDGNLVSFNFTTKLITGKVFDTSIESVALANGIRDPRHKYTPVGFMLGRDAAIKGLIDGMYKAKKGAKFDLIVPSKIAYGEEGVKGLIPPYSPILFEIEILDIK